MASLGAYGDVVEPQTEMAAAITSTMDANCWGGKVRVPMPNDEESGKSEKFVMAPRRPHQAPAARDGAARDPAAAGGGASTSSEIDIDNSCDVGAC